jgi:hypothetical protein
MTDKKTKKVEPEARTITVVALDELTYGELDTFETIVGSLPTDGDMSKLPTGKVMIALGLISAQRDDPTVTEADVRALPMGAIQLEGAAVNP